MSVPDAFDSHGGYIGSRRGTRGRTAAAPRAVRGGQRAAARLVRRAIPIGPTAAPMARDALATFADTLGPSLLSHAQLLISELVTQRVRLARDDRHRVLDLDILLTTDYLRLEVTDDDLRPPAKGGPQVLGWELQPVAELADRWGMRHGARTTVWLELDL